MKCVCVWKIFVIIYVETDIVKNNFKIVNSLKVWTWFWFRNKDNIITKTQIQTFWSIDFYWSIRHSFRFRSFNCNEWKMSNGELYEQTKWKTQNIYIWQRINMSEYVNVYINMRIRNNKNIIFYFNFFDAHNKNTKYKKNQTREIRRTRKKRKRSRRRKKHSTFLLFNNQFRARRQCQAWLSKPKCVAIKHSKHL